jgi:photosystem II stability/assembly factor-like uncharacterized protein
MIDEPLDRLRRSNPVTTDVSAPPIDGVLRRIAAEEIPPPSTSRWPRLAGAVGPTLSAVAAIAVAVVAIVVVGGHADRTPAVPTPTSSAPIASTPTAPAGGMRGVVEAYGVAFPDPEHGLISLEQCQPCHAAQVYADWLAATTDGGRSWTVQRRPWTLFDPRFSGARDGWAFGLRLVPGTPGIAGDYDTHDGGRTWSPASSVLPADGAGNVSVAGGEVWAVGVDCNPGCRAAVMRGPASGSSLPATPAQPISGRVNLQVEAGSADAAYVEASVGREVMHFATHDGGRTWQRISTACRHGVGDAALAAGGPTSLWEQCLAAGDATVLGRSGDGGRHWHTYPLPLGGLYELKPITSRIAWAVTVHGGVIRTTDGGEHWSAMWSVGRSQPTGLQGHSASLSVQSAETAEVIVSLTRGHVQHHAQYTNFVVYRTTDGGRSWQPSVVRLPAG